MEKEVFGAVSTLAHYEMPKKIALLESYFSLDKGEMTPTQKVKRKVVDRNYKDVIDAMYAD
jgi:long-chain acyl-CoA synthetase